MEPSRPRLGSRVLAAGVLLGSLVRLAALPLPGTGDVMVWKIWSHAASESGVVQMYGVGGTPTERRVHAYDGKTTTVDYPPIALAALGAVGTAYRTVTGGFANTAALTGSIKVVTFFADAGIACLLWFAVRRIRPDHQPSAVIAALGYWLNPAVLVNGAVLGYLDPWYGLPIMAALLAATFGRPGVAGVCLAVAVLTKPQAVILAPLVGLVVANVAEPPARVRALTTAFAAGAAVAVAVVLPFVLAGAWPNVLQAMASLGRHNALSAQATNPWWIVTYVMRAAYAVGELGWHDAFLQPVRRPLMVTTLVDLGYPNPRMLASAIVVGLLAWGLWTGRRARQLDHVAVLAGWSVFAFYMFGLAAHENHGYLLAPALALAAALQPEWRGTAAWLSLTMAMTLNAFYGMGDRVGWAIPRTWAPPDTTVWVSVAHVVLFVVYARRMRRTFDPTT